jgi:hypothetical protein
MLKHSIITVAIFALATILYITGLTTEKQPWLFIVAFIYWVGAYVFNSIYESYKGKKKNN